MKRLKRGQIDWFRRFGHRYIYTRRKEFDAEGRKLVAELQRAVGDRFHVSFRSWVTFDPKHWRTLWRDEDLFSGASEENWFNDDLPDEVVVKVVKIYPDFGGAYLWDMNGWGIGNDAPAFPDELDERFMAWANLWDEAYNFDTHQVDRWRLSRIGFDQQGIDLAVELKRAVGTATKVIYCCQLREPALEVFEGGSTIEWPRNTDFRQWALDSVQGGKDKK